jgi:hypothetical protein
MHNAAKTLVNARCPTQLTLKRTTVSLVNVALQPPVTGERVDPSTGGRASTNLLTQNTTWLITKRSASGGKRNRGRWFFPGVPDVSVNDVGVLNVNEVTDWNTALFAYLQTVLAAATIEGLYILHSQGTGGGGPLAPTAITSLTCDSRVATQRKRMRR